MLMLQVIKGPDRDAVYALPDDEPQLIGRSTEALPTTDTMISRRHAELTPDGGSWSIHDLDSANGTFVNGRRITARTRLGPPDEIRCGGTTFRLLRAVASGASSQQERLATMGRTVASISHSVKNILQGLRSGAGAIELALNRDDLALAREGWPVLARSLDRIHDLTYNMLAYARAAHLEIELEPLGGIIHDIAELIEPQCARKRATLSIELGEAIPPVPIDAHAIHQAIMNLMTNAVEAIPSKTGEIRIATRFDAEVSSVMIEVHDNGPGIEPDRHAMIFEPFTSSKGQRGTGLGLAVTRKIVQEHGGEIELASALGEGTIFTIVLPTDTSGGDPGETHGPRPGETPDVETRFGF